MEGMVRLDLHLPGQLRYHTAGPPAMPSHRFHQVGTQVVAQIQYILTQPSWRDVDNNNYNYNNIQNKNNTAITDITIIEQ